MKVVFGIELRITYSKDQVTIPYKDKGPALAVL